MIKHFFRIIRLPNLLMLAGIQVLIYFKLIDQTITQLNLVHFGELSMITILLAAGGYVINDYFDREIDSINKPDRVLASGVWQPTSVLWIYIFLMACGALLSFILAIQLHLLIYIFIYPFAAAGLWLYSYSLKCKPVIGNLWVALFCAGVIMIVALPDIILQNKIAVNPTMYYYLVFAFLSTWYREIVKDIEDIPGDAKISCRTLPVMYGEKIGKIVAMMIGASLFIPLISWENNITEHWMSFGLLIIEGLTLASMAFVWWAKSSYYYHQASSVIKFVMAAGTALLFLIK